MSLDDIFGPHEGRPQHRDMTLMSDALLEHDGKTEDPDFELHDYIATKADPRTVFYVASQRASMNIDHATEMRGADPALVQLTIPLWLDGFLTGIAFAERKAREPKP